MRICLVYDCLFPYTVGGAERWYRNLAERLSADGHEVTYLTLRQWPRDEQGRVEGVRVLGVGPRMALYTQGGRRRTLPPLVFGVGVFLHLLRHGRSYEVVHTASFPYFSLLAAGVLRPLLGYRLVVDWHEVWSRGYWREYLGRLGGAFGYAVQLACARLPQQAFCFSRLHARRLRQEGLKGTVQVLEGEYAGSLQAPVPRAADPVVVFAGRMIREKRAPAGVAGVAAAARRIPGLRGTFFGDGPEREQVLAEIERQQAASFIEAPGFVASEEVDAALQSATCMLLPSRREGYGMVVVEASARATPSVVVADEDNAATELIAEGVNGTVAASATPETLADAIVRVHEAGLEMRRSTAAWFAENARRLSLESSLETVLAIYAGASARE
ncbi:MAG TPA: glycosyltransferase [Solirubrobacteraceae bacterium]|nr:glycosyltransferase [Solirubrobacteraceae bacterium]